MSAKENAKRHMEICQRLNKTYYEKNKDYGDSFGQSYEEFGLISGVVRIGDKYSRLKNLASGQEIEVEDESIKDTLLDMANYCIMTLMEIEKREEDKKIE